MEVRSSGLGLLEISPKLLYSILHNPESIDDCQLSYMSARKQLAAVLDRVTKDREVVIIKRRGKRDVAMIPADELAGLTETAYLLRSPQTAQRILSALARALKNKG